MEIETEAGPVQIGDLFERYQILKLLGQGGYASVYHARREFIDRDVAIKISNRSVNREVFRRFQSEARLTNKLKHPNIVEVLDADVASSGHLYIVMELLRGQTFWDARKQYGKLTIPEALLLCAQVADGVEQAHRVGAIHRDLKPLNLFIVENNHVKVLDFGIAKLADAEGSSTQRNVIHGTLKYMSPEQLMGKALTPRSDIYALGVILFELLSGQHPQISENVQLTEAELGWAIAARLAPMLDEVDSAIPRHVARAVQSALAKQPEQRFESMAAFASVLRECRERYLREQANQTAEARPLWRPAAAASATFRTSESTAVQEHAATAVVEVVPAQSLRPTIRVGTSTAATEDAHGSSEAQGVPTPVTRTSNIVGTPAPVSGGVAIARPVSRLDAQRLDASPRFSLRRVLSLGAAVGFLVGAGLTFARLSKSGSPAPSSSASGSALSLASAVAEREEAATLPALPSPSPTEHGEPASTSAPAVAPSAIGVPASGAPVTRQPAVVARQKSRQPSSEKKIEDRLNWFQQDGDAKKPSAKSGL